MFYITRIENVWILRHYRPPKDKYEDNFRKKKKKKKKKKKEKKKEIQKYRNQRNNYFISME